MSGVEASARPRLPALDGLRGLAIVMVLFVHFVGDATPETRLERVAVKLANYGIWGVDLFFVLSGFLITGILHDSRGDPHYFRTFFVRRVLRIFPLYYATLAVLFLVLPLLPVPYPSGLEETASHQAWLWAYGTNFYVALHRDWALPYVSHFWSLAVEEHFYFVWPFLVLYLSDLALLRSCVAGALLALFLRVGLAVANAGDVALTALTPCRLDALLLGSFLVIATRRWGGERVLGVARRALPASVGAILLATAWNAVTHGTLRNLVLPLRTTLVATAFGALLVQCIDTRSRPVLRAVFEGRLLRFLGKYSYGIYVFHGIIAYALVRYGVEHRLGAHVGSHVGAVVLQACAGVVASVAVAVASFETFEKRMLRMKDRLSVRALVAIAAVVVAIVFVTTACAPSLARRPAARESASFVNATVDAARDRHALDPAASTSSAGTALVASPLLSRDARVVGSSSARFADARRAVDGDYRSAWEAGRPTEASPSWIAIDVGEGPERLLVSWSAAGSFDYLETDYGSPGAYRIATSADSTDGADGAWTTVADVREVRTHAAAHLVDFAGKRWVKLVVTGTPLQSPNGVQLTEIDVHDATAGAADTWFFMGDSITAFAFSRVRTPGPTFADAIHARHPAFFPAIIDGGIGGQNASDGARHVDEWIATNPTMHFFGVAYGTNDAAGDARDTRAFRAAMETIVRHLVAAGRVPLLATIPFASDGQHAHVADFNNVIEEVRNEAALARGPDLYSWFAAHPDELRDGVHPNERGIASINRLWAEAVEPFYAR